jgi:hypothetical protein
MKRESLGDISTNRQLKDLRSRLQTLFSLNSLNKKSKMQLTSCAKPGLVAKLT